MLLVLLVLLVVLVLLLLVVVLLLPGSRRSMPSCSAGPTPPRMCRLPARSWVAAMAMAAAVMVPLHHRQAPAGFAAPVLQGAAAAAVEAVVLLVTCTSAA